MSSHGLGELWGYGLFGQQRESGVYLCMLCWEEATLHNIIITLSLRSDISQRWGIMVAVEITASQFNLWIKFQNNIFFLQLIDGELTHANVVPFWSLWYYRYVYSIDTSQFHIERVTGSKRLWGLATVSNQNKDSFQDQDTLYGEL